MSRFVTTAGSEPCATTATVAGQSTAHSASIGARSRLALLALLGVTLAGFAPEPDPVPRRWQLDVKLGPLRFASMDVPGTGPRAYFYMTYTVTNTSGADVLLAPAWDLATSDGHIIRSGRNVPASVTRELITRLENPYLQDQIDIIGILMQGEENAKDGLVVWTATDFRLDEISVYGAGFSGEAKPFDVLNTQTGEREKILLRKTIMARYQTPGDIERSSSDPFEPYEVRWIMR
ncbi:MAG: hypothetical protein KF787_10930 [Phycisphaeraceae bacterium]|nr:hypothetical protein [Phycisphaerae bacterium]MBX3393149.1 hypothetical protein [Phycisphaeraceae bacterium]HRJ50189.1 hypothetical protein [Phycisphaerales bacterium]